MHALGLLWYVAVPLCQNLAVRRGVLSDLLVVASCTPGVTPDNHVVLTASY